MFSFVTFFTTITKIFKSSKASPSLGPLGLVVLWLALCASVASGASATANNSSYVPVATLSRDIGVSVGKYTGWIGVNCGIFQRVPVLPSLPPVPSLPGADSLEFVLLSVPPSSGHLAEDDRLERGRRRLAHGQQLLRRNEADFGAHQESHRREVARSKSVQIYTPPVPPCPSPPTPSVPAQTPSSCPACPNDPRSAPPSPCNFRAFWSSLETQVTHFVSLIGAWIKLGLDILSRVFQSFAACASWVRVVFSGAVTVGLLLEQTDRRTMLTPLWYPQQRATSFFGQLAELVQRAFGRVDRRQGLNCVNYPWYWQGGFAPWDFHPLSGNIQAHDAPRLGTQGSRWWRKRRPRDPRNDALPPCDDPPPPPPPEKPRDVDPPPSAPSPGPEGPKGQKKPEFSTHATPEERKEAKKKAKQKAKRFKRT
ncbi:hypothetical protein QFC20_000868 [Naganishia adeliensis]|uniref:Uncharacterized protein n=1 Tax=Naganishia adeliensis TaxID=92952 RepID=A0ACC2WXE5_9TREE|nr:hypothetical protein QFC20_000868 [Naganishia adeliensis]